MWVSGWFIIRHTSAQRDRSFLWPTQYVILELTYYFQTLKLVLYDSCALQDTLGSHRNRLEIPRLTNHIQLRSFMALYCNGQPKVCGGEFATESYRGGISWKLLCNVSSRRINNLSFVCVVTICYYKSFRYFSIYIFRHSDALTLTRIRQTFYTQRDCLRSVTATLRLA